MQILGVDIADHTAASLALRLDGPNGALAERIGLALDGHRLDLPISPDEALALLHVLHDGSAEARLRAALEGELSRQRRPGQGFGRWGHRRPAPPA